MNTEPSTYISKATAAKAAAAAAAAAPRRPATVADIVPGAIIYKGRGNLAYKVERLSPRHGVVAAKLNKSGHTFAAPIEHWTVQA